MEIQGGVARNVGPGLYEFLMEAELQHYYAGIKGDLKVQTTAQLKYVTEEDLSAIGMSKPEMRRLKKYFQKHFPQNYLSKFKKMLLSKREEQCSGALSVLSEEKQEKPPIKVPNKHMIPADAIIVNKELGVGEFGVVQQGVWTNDGERIQVAIKCLSRERMQNNPIEFLKEAAIMHSIDHEHIVRLYGVVLDTNSLMLVTELAPLRSLLECLKEPSLRASFPVLSLCDFAIQIADGMQYLETKRLIHRDLAARNILVFSKNKVKISDFGLSRALGVGKDYYQTNFNVNLKLPIAWCAPECISYLKFTSSSDVWAYGVTLWEMFSYGFQPWAALTGHQILEAIDEPNFQRLEQPDCCPREYFSLMQQCWQHEPLKRPKFCELVHLLPDLKPEQVQAVQESAEIGQLAYRQGDIITVLNKSVANSLWKGVLSSGKTGLFNPAHTIAYLGSNLPSNKPGEFCRGDGKNAFSSHRRKIRPDMISSPQGDVKHTGHVGLDGAYFGDISFLGGKYPHVPRQVVTPYKPHEDVTDHSSQGFSPPVNSEASRECSATNSGLFMTQDMINKHESDNTSELSQAGTIARTNPQSMISVKGPMVDNVTADHEYHEISDEENQDSTLRFDKPLDFDFGPSLLDEMDQMFRSLGSSTPTSNSEHPTSAEHESSNVRNELREMQAKQSTKKKQATVKPISAADQKTLYSAIAMAQELTARSMTDLEYPPESPRTPASPSRRRKFSFKLPHQHSPKPDRRHFSEEAASIPDIQWLCSSLQSLSSTVSSIESLGAPSTLKLPLWDKASAEFCFAKSRELLTKPSAWTTYMDVEFDSHIFENNAVKQNLIKSSEFLENGNCGKSMLNYGNRRDSAPSANGKVSFRSNPSLDDVKKTKRISTSYVDRYFHQSKYFDEDGIFEYIDGTIHCYGEKKISRPSCELNNLDHSDKAQFSTNSYDYNNINPELTAQNGKNNLKENSNSSCSVNLQLLNAQQNSLTTSKSLLTSHPTCESPRSMQKKISIASEGSELGTKPKIPIVTTSMEFNNFSDDDPKGLDTRKLRTNFAKPSTKAIYLPLSTDKSIFRSSMSKDNSKDFDTDIQINLPNYRQLEKNRNGHEPLPFLISNNPLFISDSDKQDSPIHSSSESLRMNFQRLRRKSDVEIKNQVELGSKHFTDKYSRDVSDLENVKNYLDAKKGPRFNLGLAKLTQNMIQLGKNIAQNSRNLESPPVIKSQVSNMTNIEILASDQALMKNITASARGGSGRSDLNIPLATPKNTRLNLIQLNIRPKSPVTTAIHHHHHDILEPPKLYQNEIGRGDFVKPEIVIDNVEANANNVYRPRTCSLSDAKKSVMKNVRRSFHPGDDSSEDSDSVSHSETDIRSRFRHRRRHKKVPQSLCFDFKTRGLSVYPDMSKISTIENAGKSPPPSTSFLNSLSPPFSSRNNILSWPESAPSSSLTFTSNSDLDSDTSSEYREFANDISTFPPSPAP